MLRRMQHKHATRVSLSAPNSASQGQTFHGSPSCRSVSNSLGGEMKSERVFLKQNVLVEPLFNRWYAWSYLISPASAAMYIANQHLKIMQSFVAAPQSHVAALKNPAMIGGPFINYPESRAGDVKALLS